MDKKGVSSKSLYLESLGTDISAIIEKGISEEMVKDLQNAINYIVKSLDIYFSEIEDWGNVDELKKLSIFKSLVLKLLDNIDTSFNIKKDIFLETKLNDPNDKTNTPELIDVISKRKKFTINKIIKAVKGNKI